MVKQPQLLGGGDVGINQTIIEVNEFPLGLNFRVSDFNCSLIGFDGRAANSDEVIHK